jgi:uncharacterized C2H2 Zn-finger protein
MRKLDEIKCGKCGAVFANKEEMMKHKKEAHGM